MTALQDETSPLTSNGGDVQYGSSDADGSTNRSEQKAFKGMLANWPTDLKSSIHNSYHGLKDLVNEHTGQIGYLGSMAIAVNSLTGPAMLHLPATFQRSGMIPTLATLLFVCILAAMCSLHMANTISKVPGNDNFKQEVEYPEAFKAFWGNRWFVFSQVLFFLCVTCLNISSIVDTAQTVDTVLGNIKTSVALYVQIPDDENPNLVGFFHWAASECTPEMHETGTCLPFSDDDAQGVILTLGYVLCTVIFLPLALLDLKENAFAQIVGFLVLLVTSVQFSVTFAMNGIDFSNISWWGESWDGLFGVIMFNFALVIAVPAWLYEKEEHVDVPTVIHGSSALSLVLYIFLGALGTLSMPNVAENMLESMESGAHGLGLQIGASVFAFFIIGLGVPLFSVLTRLSLTGSKLCSRPVANCLAVYLPFGVGWFLYRGKGVTELLSWGGVICTSLVAFFLPLLLSLHTVQDFDFGGSIDVYNGLIQATSKRGQVLALRVLLVLATISILAALAGNLMDSDQDDDLCDLRDNC